MEIQAGALMQQVDAIGGSIAAIESGFMQEQIAKSAYNSQRQVEGGEKIIVGVNRFLSKEKAIPTFAIDESIRNIQTE